MPISDSEPRYRLVDGTGTVIASFYLDDSDGFNIQEATNNNEITLASDGTVAFPTLNADVAVLAQELGIPEYDDVANAPQTQNRIVYATGAGVTPEGVYKHNGTSYERVGAFTDSDEDGTYTLPNASDGIDVGDVITDTATIDGKTGIGIPTATGSISATLGGGWVSEDANRPTMIYLEVEARTDGTTTAVVDVEIDFSGGTTSDVELQSIATANASSGFQNFEVITFILPPGGQYRVVNTADPQTANNITKSLKQTL